jgi:hypothetical protein
MATCRQGVPGNGHASRYWKGEKRPAAFCLQNTVLEDTMTMLPVVPTGRRPETEKALWT